ncbi:hypothetical protein ACF3MZ_23520 [Paenibacillaceae bacterium WGS1546]|uniref:hypothetical protein n=1 Tax=Cohnella sp. WGS1546 TaxID=3366810 RepID=UPI00372D19CD
MKELLNKTRKIYRNARISRKLFLAFSLMIVIPAILVSFLFIRTQETQLYKDAMAAGSSHVSRLNEQLRSRMEMLENASSTALTQKAFVDFIHSNMRGDGLRLVKFRQNQFEQMHNIIQSHELISELSFYVDNRTCTRSGPRSTITTSFGRRITGQPFGTKAARPTACLPSRTASIRCPTTGWSAFRGSSTDAPP